MTATEEPPISIYEEIGHDIGSLVTKKQSNMEIALDAPTTFSGLSILMVSL